MTIRFSCSHWDDRFFAAKTVNLDWTGTLVENWINLIPEKLLACVWERKFVTISWYTARIYLNEGGVGIFGFAVLTNFWFGFSVFARFWYLAGLRSFSNLVFGLLFLSTIMAVFPIFCPMHFRVFSFCQRRKLHPGVALKL